MTILTIRNLLVRSGHISSILASSVRYVVVSGQSGLAGMLSKSEGRVFELAGLAGAYSAWAGVAMSRDARSIVPI